MHIVVAASLLLISLARCLTCENTTVSGSPAECSGCSIANVISQNDISPEELKEIRMEMIKQQILRKLRLKEPPNVENPAIPEMLVEEQFLTVADPEQKEYEGKFTKEDFYGSTQQVAIFPENASTHNCYTRDLQRPSSCFRFRLTREITSRSISSAELWAYKVGSNPEEENEIDDGEEEEDDHSSNCTYTITDVSPDPHGDGLSKRIVAVEDTTSSPGWITFQLGPAIRTWALRRHMAHALEISCSGCDQNLESPVSLMESQKPFIVVKTDPWKSTPRMRRSFTCTETSTHCCKERFTVNFTDIEWNRWIIYPPAYEANFCRGSCLADVAASRYHHTTVLRRYIHRKPARSRNITLALCCTPYAMRPLTLIYIDEKNNIYKTALPNMIVDSCECA